MSRILVCSSLLGAGVLASLYLDAPALPVPTAHAQEAKKLEPYYFGNEMCAGCHDCGDIQEARKRKLGVDFMRGTEMGTWDKFDKHKYATENLDQKKYP